MTLNHNYECSNEAVTGIAGNGLGLGEVAEPECLIELLNLKIKNE